MMISILYERPMSFRFETKYYHPLPISSNFQNFGFLLLPLTRKSCNTYMSCSAYKPRPISTEAAQSIITDLASFGRKNEKDRSFRERDNKKSIMFLPGNLLLKISAGD